MNILALRNHNSGMAETNRFFNYRTIMSYKLEYSVWEIKLNWGSKKRKIKINFIGDSPGIAPLFYYFVFMELRKGSVQNR